MSMSCVIGCSLFAKQRPSSLQPLSQLSYLMRNRAELSVCGLMFYGLVKVLPDKFGTSGHNGGLDDGAPGD